MRASAADALSRSISSAAASWRLLAAPTWARSRASRSARFAAARASSAIRRSTAASCASAPERSATAALSRSRPALQPGLQAVLFLAELGRLPFQLGGIPAGPLGLRLSRQVVVPLLGQAVRGAEPFGQ